MQVSVEATGTLERQITVDVPQERIESEVTKRLQQLARTTRIKGFRPGKVPFKVVAKRFGGEVRQEVLGDVIQSTFYEAVSKENLRPAGAPTIEPVAGSDEGGLQYKATFEVFPEITLADLDTVKISKTVAEVTAEDIDNMMETLRKQRTTWKAVERAASEGDRVVCDFTGTIDGEEFSGNKGSDVPVTIGGKRMIEGFEEGLVGASAGDELTLDLTFPENYGNAELAGKPVKFDVKVHTIETAELPELDDEFATSFGIDEGGVDALRAEVEKNMQRELKGQIDNKVKQSVMDAILEANSIEVPKALIQQEAAALKQQMQQQMHTPPGKTGVDLDTDMFAEQAERRVALGMLLSEIVNANGLKVDPDKVRQTVEEMAASYAEPEQVINWYYGDKKRLAEIESIALEEQVVDWVLSKAQIEETNSSFSEVMNSGQ